LGFGVLSNKLIKNQRTLPQYHKPNLDFGSGEPNVHKKFSNMKKIFFAILLLNTFGCSKDNSTQKLLEDVFASQRDALPSEIQILELLKAPTDGYAILSSYATLAIQDLRGPEIMIQGFGYSKAGIKSDFGTLTFGNINTNINTSFDYRSLGATGAKDLFGTTNSVALFGANNLPGFSTNFYIPKLMTITSPAFSNNSVIFPGTTITWEPDTNNTTFGVGIAILYSPNSPENLHLQLSESPVRNYIRSADTGSYTISTNDLAGIPTGATLSFGIGRGNYQRNAMPNGYYFGIASFSVVEHYFTRQ
jgi:hypothetical protein